MVLPESMQSLLDYLVAHMGTYIFIVCILVLALIGYFVDQKEQAKGISKLFKTSTESDIKELASRAQK